MSCHLSAWRPAPSFAKVTLSGQKAQGEQRVTRQQPCRIRAMADDAPTGPEPGSSRTTTTIATPFPGGRAAGAATAAAAGGGGDSSYLTMWKRAQERKREVEPQLPGFESSSSGDSGGGAESVSDRERGAREQRFLQMLEVPEEERRRVEKQQVVDRAAAALAAAQSLLLEVEAKQRLQRQKDRGRAVVAAPSASAPAAAAAPSAAPKKSSLSFTGRRKAASTTPQTSPGPSLASPAASTQSAPIAEQQPLYGSKDPDTFLGSDAKPAKASWGSGGAPGGGSAAGGGGSQKSSSSSKLSDFWSWVPPPKSSSSAGPASLPPELKRATAAASSSIRAAVMERPSLAGATLDLPFQKDAEGLKLEGATQGALTDLEAILKFSSSSSIGTMLPPLQSRVQVIEPAEALAEITTAAPRIQQVGKKASAPTAAPSETEGVMPDGSRWWRTTGRDEGPLGEVTEWTVVRGVSADGAVEWEEKWWESWDAFDYKEMGAEKSGRDASGSVWRESWQEAMWQDKQTGLTHMEKSADKWGQDGRGGEWHEKWWEHYDAMGRAEKWADKWSKIDPSTPLDEGHAHVWHEKWGEEFDGKGAASKYCDKWAERCVDVEGNAWTKWGDKWDEGFDRNAHGFKRGETWWQGAGGENWNRTWSEGHGGTGWVHKMGQSSSGEYWDVHEPMDTWYERKPHFGFKECMQNSHRLKQVGKKKQSL